MVSWRKVYVVGDKKKKQSSYDGDYTPSQPPRKHKRAGVRYLWVFIFVCTSFSSGMYLGLREDFEAESFVGPNLAAELLGETSDENIRYASIGMASSSNSANVGGAHIFCDYKREYSQHFMERIDCRDISQQEVDHVLKYGVVKRFFPNNYDKRTSLPQPKFNLVAKTYTGRDILISFTVPQSQNKIVLVTAYPDDGIKDDCE